MSLIEARQRCNELKAMVNNGTDPQEKQQLLQIPSFGDFVKLHYLPYAYTNKRSAHADESKFKHHLLPLLEKRRIDQISTQELQQYHDQLKNTYCPATANRHLSLLHRLFKLAIQWGFLEKNPAAGIRKHQENNERKRYLSDEEIVKFIDALKLEENQVAAAAFELLLYTGVRRQEALDARWEHIDLQRKTWFIPMSKSGKSRHVILNPMAIELLKKQAQIPGNPYLFPGKIAGNQINNPQKSLCTGFKSSRYQQF